MNIPLSKICYLGNEEEYGIDAIKTRRISGQGVYVQKFEALIAEKTQRKYCLVVSNATLALELALRALDIGFGDEVIVPAFTFASPAASVMAVGAKPVFVDICEDHWTIDPAEVKKAISSKTKAIIPVDLMGHPCDYDQLLALGIPLIEDAAQAHGAAYKGKPTGSFGVASVFSFHANKAISTGEGGCILTDDEQLAKKMRLLVNHGMDPRNRYWHELPGRNYRMTNLSAAIGTAQVENWDQLVNRRKQVGATYTQAFAHKSLTIRKDAAWATPVCWLYTLTSPNSDFLIEYLRSEGIDARSVWYPLPDCPAYRHEKVISYKVTSRLAKEAFWLPTYGDMTREEQDYVISTLLVALENLKVLNDM